jgi:hypothetical protein
LDWSHKMATFSFSALPAGDTLEHFLSWAGDTASNASASPTGPYHGVSHGIASFGWTRTADTGQVDWDTISAVPTAGTWVYEIWQMNDALQGTTPVIMKIEYGKSSVSPGAPSVFVTIGTNGSDGAGTLHTPHSVRQSHSSCTSGSQTTQLLNMWMSGDTGSLRMLLFNGFTTSPNYWDWILVVISRLNDASGNPVSTGVVICGTDLSSSTLSCTSDLVWSASIGGSGIRETSKFIAALPTDVQGTNLNGNLLVSPVLVNVGGLSNPGIDLFLGKKEDFSVDETIQQFPVYGVTHQYIVGHNNTLNPTFVGTIASSILMRYE